MFIRRIYDFVDFKVITYLDCEPSFFMDFPHCGIGDPLERVDLAAWNNPKASQWIFVALSEENAVCLILDEQGGPNSWKCVAHRITDFRVARVGGGILQSP